MSKERRTADALRNGREALEAECDKHALVLIGYRRTGDQMTFVVSFRGRPDVWSTGKISIDEILRDGGKIEGIVKDKIADAIARLGEPMAAGPQLPSSHAFQARVAEWMMVCFNAEIAADKPTRNFRFLEEAVELVQACGMTKDEVLKLVDYVYGRPDGEPFQEVGGVLVTLATLCSAQGVNMDSAGDTELERIWSPEIMEKIRAKQRTKPNHSPLPGAAF